MIYLNRNVTLNQLKEVVQKNINHNINYMSDDFNDAQKNALELFQKRIYLEEIIEETVSFNKRISWDNSNPNLNLTTTAEELIEVFKLRSDVYTSINYQNECPDTIEGLNFDKFDKTSAIVYYKRDRNISATCRLIFDSKNKLPAEEKFSFDYMRTKYKRIGEISRNIVKHTTNGLNLDFKHTMGGIHNIFVNNDINMTLSGIKEEDFKLFSKFGGIEIEKNLNSYGNLDIPFLIISWNPSLASKFFKKAFLK